MGKGKECQGIDWRLVSFRHLFNLIDVMSLILLVLHLFIVIVLIISILLVFVIARGEARGIYAYGDSLDGNLRLRHTLRLFYVNPSFGGVEPQEANRAIGGVGEDKGHSPVEGHFVVQLVLKHIQVVKSERIASLSGPRPTRRAEIKVRSMLR